MSVFIVWVMKTSSGTNLTTSSEMRSCDESILMSQRFTSTPRMFHQFDSFPNRACVGIRVEPKENEDWFCRACISRKQSDQTDGKKKKRKKKDKDKRDH